MLHLHTPRLSPNAFVPRSVPGHARRRRDPLAAVYAHGESILAALRGELLEPAGEADLVETARRGTQIVAQVHAVLDIDPIHLLALLRETDLSGLAGESEPIDRERLDPYVSLEVGACRLPWSLEDRGTLERVTTGATPEGALLLLRRGRSVWAGHHIEPLAGGRVRLRAVSVVDRRHRRLPACLLERWLLHAQRGRLASLREKASAGVGPVLAARMDQEPAYAVMKAVRATTPRRAS